MFKRLNNALPGLLIGILIYGALFQIIGMWLVEDRLRYTTGLWIGIACAMFMAIHMAISIEDAVNLSEEGAKKKTIGSAMLRYIVVLGVLVVMINFNLGMMLPAFFGLLGLKISAYLQPVFQRLRDGYAKKRR
jgi:hypothetical protein